MTIEQSLAAQYIANALRDGFQKSFAIRRAAALLKAQGFSAKHAKAVAEQMANLL